MTVPTVIVVIKYGKPNKVTHSYTRTFMQADGDHCPGCGYVPIWMEDELGDYYLGPVYVCPSCGNTGHLTWGSGMGKWQEEQVVDAIRDSGTRSNDE